MIDVQLSIERNRAGRFDYVITTASGYRAVIERCDRDDCAAGRLPECRRQLDYRKQHETGGRNSVDAWLRHAARYCHGWHDGRIENFIVAVRRTYGSYKPLRLARLVALPRMPDVAVANMLGITIHEYRTQLARASRD